MESLWLRGGVLGLGTQRSRVSWGFNFFLFTTFMAKQNIFPNMDMLLQIDKNTRN